MEVDVFNYVLRGEQRHSECKFKSQSFIGMILQRGPTFLEKILLSFKRLS